MYFRRKEKADISSHSCPEERRHPLVVVTDVSCHRHRYSCRVSVSAVGVCWQEAVSCGHPPVSVSAARKLGRHAETVTTCARSVCRKWAPAEPLHRRAISAPSRSVVPPVQALRQWACARPGRCLFSGRSILGEFLTQLVIFFSGNTSYKTGQYHPGGA